MHIKKFVIIGIITLLLISIVIAKTVEDKIIKETENYKLHKIKDDKNKTKYEYEIKNKNEGINAIEIITEHLQNMKE